jgi:hypothetical protein
MGKNLEPESRSSWLDILKFNVVLDFILHINLCGYPLVMGRRIDIYLCKNKEVRC